MSALKAGGGQMCYHVPTLTRYKWVLGSLPLPKDKADTDNEADNERSDDVRRLPGMLTTSPCEPQYQDCRAS